MLVGPGAQLAAAQPSDPGPGGPNIASESPANRAIAAQASYDGLLQLGDNGPAVVKVQRALGLEADGAFDKGTENGVRAYQDKQGLVVDGLVGPKTWGALFGGSGSGAAAATGGSLGKASIPAASGAQAGTQFAVRGVDEEEARQVGISNTATESDSGKGGAVVAIDLRLPGGESGDSNGSGSGSASSQLGSDNGNQPQSSRRAAGTLGSSGQPGSGSSGQPGSGAISPEDLGSAISGSCGSGKLVHPLSGRGSFSSGWRTGARPSHAGIDIAAPTGTPIRAAACGVVSLLQGTSQSGGYGNYICIDHSRKPTVTTCYAHLSRFSDERVGSQVKAGEIIGYVGSTGRSTGPHLHFEVRNGGPRGRDMNPVPYLQGRTFSGTPTVKASAAGTGGPDLTHDSQAVQETAPAASEPVEEATGANSPATRSGESDLSSEAASETSTANGESSAGADTSVGAEVSDREQSGDAVSKPESPLAGGQVGASEGVTQAGEDTNSQPPTPASGGGEGEASETEASGAVETGEEPSAGSGYDGESRTDLEDQDEEDSSPGAAR